jgi:uncharacterized iron-regulated membrane protein
MPPDLIFTLGAALCGIALLLMIIMGLVMHISKKRLNKQLDAEYGKRRH